MDDSMKQGTISDKDSPESPALKLARQKTFVKTHKQLVIANMNKHFSDHHNHDHGPKED